MSARRVAVALGERAYEIHIGPGLLARGELLAPLLRGRHVLIVSDTTVAPIYAERVRASIAPSHAVARLDIPAGEAHKNLTTLARVFDALAELKASRDATVLALGGGVVGDLAGFAAACWMRGVAFVQLPTTLLAMVDSSVGGKTAIDLAQGKNLVGAFHQPAGVIADTDTLMTLPPRELAAGLAEVVKYGALGDVGFIDWLEARVDALNARDPEALTDAIAISCQHKAGIVARDERETGERALLNLGHTFAHAIETATGYDALRHGEAVAIGMVLAARLSERLGLAPGADGERLRALLDRFALPTRLPAGLDARGLVDLMRLDKKAASGRLRLILWHGLGRADIVPDVAEAEVLATLREAGAR